MERIEYNGLQFSVETHYDDGMGAPWKEHDGHGPVSEWRSNSYSIYPEKRPGERVLCSDRHSYRFYDWQEAMRIAKRDGWGLSDEHRAKLANRLGREPTQGDITAEAVQRDFDYLRRWCNDQWHWCYVQVTLLDAEGDETPEFETLGGLDSDSTDYIMECAQELAEQIADRIGSSDTLHIHSTARDTSIRLRA